MAEQPSLWQKADRIQWGCVLMDLLGERSLLHLHVVLSGLQSIEQSLQGSPYIQAIRTARVILGDLVTRHSVQNAVYEYVQQGKQRSFTIDINPERLTFASTYSFDLDPNIAQARTILNRPLPRAAHGLALADTSKDYVIETGPGRSFPIRLHGVTALEPRQHDTTRRPRQPIHVSMAQLRDLAAELDLDDHRNNRTSQDWSGRVNFLLRKTTGSGLREAEQLTLDSLTHLIGLPGAGKTTLLNLLCILLGRRGLKVAVFFTSIEVAREYLETLRRYDVKVALLVGRSGQTHRTHANRMAELIAGQGNGGFGHTREGAELFATSCALPAFAPEWPSDWVIGDAPCERLTDAESEKRYLCPMWELCGRVKNHRDLVTAQVWLGHVISADTTVPAHTVEERMRYFELIAETFDLAIFDECDESQKVLDDYGALTLQLSGNDDSLHGMLQDLTGLLATNRTRVSDDLLRYVLQANEFGQHMLRFLVEVRHLSKKDPRLADTYADTLLTANFLLREAIIAAGVGGRFNDRMRSALSDFWERALYRAFFHRAVDDDTWPKAETYASDLDLRPDEARASWQRVNRSLKRYLAVEHEVVAEPMFEAIEHELLTIMGAKPKARITAHVRLLVTVGFAVASYQRLAQSARPLAWRGEIPSKYIFARASEELRALVPRSVLGTYSGVRYRKSPDRGGFEFDYLVMDTTPRLMPHRLHRYGRVNVLLTSATSWLRDSTTYHVDHPPSYVICPATDEIGDIKMYIHPKLHPVSREPLRFSGGGSDREHNLRLMVAALAQAEPDHLSEIARAVLATCTPLGRPRKVALVVNSYAQVELVVEHIHAINPELGQRTRGVVAQIPTHAPRDRHPRYILKGHVEALGSDQDIDVIVFPLGALGRGVNIVFHTDDGDRGRAAIGTIYFLTRPHPAAGDLSLMISLLARATHDLDQRPMQHLSLAEAQVVYNRERYRAFRAIANLLSRPMSASMLPDEVLINFAANQLVPILQTIGRGMRKHMPVNVYFVDAAWAPNSALEQPETNRSSLLVIMQRILVALVNDASPDLRDIHRALYGVFQEAFDNITGLLSPESHTQETVSMFSPSPVTSEGDFDELPLEEDLDSMSDLIDEDEEYAT